MAGQGLRLIVSKGVIFMVSHQNCRFLDSIDGVSVCRPYFSRLLEDGHSREEALRLSAREQMIMELYCQKMDNMCMYNQLEANSRNLQDEAVVHPPISYLIS